MPGHGVHPRLPLEQGHGREHRRSRSRVDVDRADTAAFEGGLDELDRHVCAEGVGSVGVTAHARTQIPDDWGRHVAVLEGPDVHDAVPDAWIAGEIGLCIGWHGAVVSRVDAWAGLAESVIALVPRVVGQVLGRTRVVPATGGQEPGVAVQVVVCIRNVLIDRRGPGVARPPLGEDVSVRIVVEQAVGHGGAGARVAFKHGVGAVTREDRVMDRDSAHRPDTAALVGTVAVECAVDDGCFGMTPTADGAAVSLGRVAADHAVHECRPRNVAAVHAPAFLPPVTADAAGVDERGTTRDADHAALAVAADRAAPDDRRRVLYTLDPGSGIVLDYAILNEGRSLATTDARVRVRRDRAVEDRGGLVDVLTADGRVVRAGDHEAVDEDARDVGDDHGVRRRLAADKRARVDDRGIGVGIPFGQLVLLPGKATVEL